MRSLSVRGRAHFAALLIAFGGAGLLGSTPALGKMPRCSAPAVPEHAVDGSSQSLAVAPIRDKTGCVGLLVTGAQSERVAIAETGPGQETPIQLGTAVVHAGVAVAANIPW